LDPDFKNNNYFYVYVSRVDLKTSVVARYTANGKTGASRLGVLSSEKILWSDPDGFRNAR
jgi:hypothetical protein